MDVYVSMCTPSMLRSQNTPYYSPGVATCRCTFVAYHKVSLLCMGVFQRSEKPTNLLPLPSACPVVHFFSRGKL